MATQAPRYRVWLRDPLTLKRMMRLDQFLTLEYGRRFRDVGDFTLTLPDGIREIDRIVGNPSGYGVCVEVRRSDLPFCEFLGFVSYQALAGDDSGGGIWTLKGWNAPGSVVRRLALPSPLTTNDLSTTAGGDYDLATGVTVAQAMRHYVNDNCIQPYETARVVASLRLGRVRRANPRPVGVVLPLDWTTIDVADTAQMTVISWRARYRDLLGDVVKGLAEAGHAGFEFVLGATPGTVEFDVVLPVDRTRGSGSGYVPVTLSNRRGTLGGVQFENNGLAVYNALYYAANGQATTRQVVIYKSPGAGSVTWINPDPYGDPFVAPSSVRNWDRRETIVAGGSTGAPYDPVDPAGFPSIAQEAAAKLAEYADTKRMTFSPRDTDVEGYRRTWDVGDKIRAIVERKGYRGAPDPAPITAQADISEVRIKVGPAGPPDVTVSLGAPPRNLLDVIRELSKTTRPAGVI